MLETAQQLALSETLGLNTRLKSATVLAVLTALSDRGYHVLGGEELAAILADLNELIDAHVPARTGRDSHAYVRSQELVALLDARLNRS